MFIPLKQGTDQAYFSESQTSASSWCNMVYDGPNFPWTIRMEASSFSVYDSLNKIQYTCNAINNGLFTGAFLRMENTGDLVLYDGSGNVQWLQGKFNQLLKELHLRKIINEIILTKSK